MKTKLMKGEIEIMENKKLGFTDKKASVKMITENDKEYSPAMLSVYHGSNQKIEKPNLSHSRTNIDFGKGFYLTSDEKMAKKWASNKQSSIVNHYVINESFVGLRVARLNAGEEWLDFVAYNRGMSEETFDVSGIDVIIGPTADDKLYKTLERFFDNTLTRNEAIKCLTSLRYSNQIVLKTQKAVDTLIYIKAQELTEKDREHWRKMALLDARKSNQVVQDVLKQAKESHDHKVIRRLGGEFDER